MFVVRLTNFVSQKRKEAGELVREYIKERLSVCEGWKELQVIFSDSSVPGEGEHKLLEFLRIQKTQSNERFSPNQRHVIYGMVNLFSL